MKEQPTYSQVSWTQHQRTTRFFVSTMNSMNTPSMCIDHSMQNWQPLTTFREITPKAAHSLTPANYKWPSHLISSWMIMLKSCGHSLSWRLTRLHTLSPDICETIKRLVAFCTWHGMNSSRSSSQSSVWRMDSSPREWTWRHQSISKGLAMSTSMSMSFVNSSIELDTSKELTLSWSSDKDWTHAFRTMSRV